MMVELDELLLNYGVLGLWTATLLFERQRTLKKMMEILTEIKNVMRIKRR